MDSELLIPFCGIAAFQKTPDNLFYEENIIINVLTKGTKFNKKTH